MKSNLHRLDRVLRFALAIAFALLYFSGTVSGTLGLVLVVAGTIFAVTGLINFCPLYRLLGVSTKK